MEKLNGNQFFFLNKIYGSGVHIVGYIYEISWYHICITFFFPFSPNTNTNELPLAVLRFQVNMGWLYGMNYSFKLTYGTDKFVGFWRLSEIYCAANLLFQR